MKSKQVNGGVGPHGQVESVKPGGFEESTLEHEGARQPVLEFRLRNMQKT